MPSASHSRRATPPLTAQRDRVACGTAWTSSLGSSLVRSPDSNDSNERATASGSIIRFGRSPCSRTSQASADTTASRRTGLADPDHRVLRGRLIGPRGRPTSAARFTSVRERNAPHVRTRCSARKPPSEEPGSRCLPGDAVTSGAGVAGCTRHRRFCDQRQTSESARRPSPLFAPTPSPEAGDGRRRRRARWHQPH